MMMIQKTKNDMKDYLERQQRKFEEYSETYRRETNEVFRELVKQLILVATVFISISVFIFNVKDLSCYLTILDKHILSTSWILLGSSLIFGIVQFFIDYYYLARCTKAKSGIVTKIYNGEANEKNLGSIVIKEQKDIPSESTTVFVWLQSIFLTIGMTLLIYIIVKLLFSI